MLKCVEMWNLQKRKRLMTADMQGVTLATLDSRRFVTSSFCYWCLSQLPLALVEGVLCKCNDFKARGPSLGTGVRWQKSLILNVLSNSEIRVFL